MEEIMIAKIIINLRFYNDYQIKYKRQIVKVTPLEYYVFLILRTMFFAVIPLSIFVFRSWFNPMTTSLQYVLFLITSSGLGLVLYFGCLLLLTLLKPFQKLKALFAPSIIESRVARNFGIVVLALLTYVVITFVVDLHTVKQGDVPIFATESYRSTNNLSVQYVGLLYEFDVHYNISPSEPLTSASSITVGPWFMPQVVVEVN